MQPYRADLLGPPAPLQSDLFGYSVTLSAQDITTYASGASAFWDATGLADAGLNIGVVATELPERTIGLIWDLLRAGKRVFCDSGAFTIFKCNLKGAAKKLDFEEVFDRYDKLMEGLPISAVSCLAIVMPDRIGDQTATFDLLMQYRTRIAGFIEAGANVIVPVQRGPLSAHDAVERTSQILGTRNFRVGIPSNAEALSTQEVAGIRHKKFHVLGKATFDDVLQRRAFALLESNPDAEISADANLLRSRTGRISATHQQMRMQSAQETQPFDQVFDETELLYSVRHDPQWMTRRQVLDLATAYGVPSRKRITWVDAHADGTLGDLIDQVDPADDRLYRFAMRSVFADVSARKHSAALRAEAVKQMFIKAA